MDIKAIYSFISVDSNNCWNWTRGKQSMGYGVAFDGVKQRLAHRISFEIANGPIPRGLFVCHTCDNPACINPAHLFLGTGKDNMQDCKKKGRMHKPPRHPHPAAKLTPAQVADIKSRLQNGESHIAIAKEIGLSRRTIYDIKFEKSWQHVKPLPRRAAARE